MAQNRLSHRGREQKHRPTSRTPCSSLTETDSIGRVFEHGAARRRPRNLRWVYGKYCSRRSVERPRRTKQRASVGTEQ